MKRISVSLLLLGWLVTPHAAADDKKPTPKFPLGKETTYITEPLQEDGYLDYEAALDARLGKGITPERNANVLIWRALGPRPEGGKGMPAAFFKALGIEDPPEQGDYFIDFDAYLRDHVKLGFDQGGQREELLEQHDRASHRPWKEIDFPHVAGWLKANEKPLALFLEASNRPDYFLPFASRRDDKERLCLWARALPSVQKGRDCAAALVTRAILRVGEGRADAAWEDLLACHRLARLLARGATLLEALVGAAVEQAACDGDLAFLDRAPLTAKQVRACIGDLQALPPMPPLADKIDLGERFIYLDVLQMIRRFGFDSFSVRAEGVRAHFVNAGGPPSRKPAPPKLDPKEQEALENLDWEPALRNGNVWYDRQAAAMRLKDRSARERELDKIDADLRALRKDVEDMGPLAKLLFDKANAPKIVGKAVGDVVVGLLMRNNHKVQIAYDRVEQVRWNLHLAFALAAFRADNDRYPAKLDDLAPKYLTAVPGDLFSGKEVVYRPSEKGYLLYSVGANGKDDEGRWYDGTPAGDDPRVRMPLPELKMTK